jgi:hypothetical protein
MNKLQFFLLVFLYILLGASQVSANDSLATPTSHLSLGLNINEIQNQPGFGLSITTPYLLSDKVAFRFSGMRFWLFDIPLSSASEEALPYVNLRFGTVYVAGRIAESIRLYLVGGVVYVLPSNEISDDERIGGYLGFGFEFFTSSIARSRISLLLESSFILEPAIAEKLPGQPIYANGIDLSVGIRYYF